MSYIRTILFALVFASTALADDAVFIREMEILRDSLPSTDQSRPILTRRIADVCFQKAVQDDKELISSGKGSVAEVEALRLKAIKNYQEALPSTTGALKNKIEYQLARLERMQSQTDKALKSFHRLAGTEGMEREIVRESILSIAEIYDEEGQWDLAQAAYLRALPYALDADGISYIRFRLAWAYFRKDRLKEAQSEMAQALYDSQKNLKEQAVLDYIQFLAATPQDNGAQALEKITEIATKEKRPELRESLGEAYFSAGNNAAGVFVLSQIQQQTPTAMRAARLSEEFYGFKRFDDMKAMLAYLQSQPKALALLEPKKQEFIDQVLRRLVVQLDGQRKSNPGQFGPELVQAIDTHLALFPQSDVVTKMRSGWLAAQTDDEARLVRLASWIQIEKDANEVRRYRTDRAAIAAKLKKTEIVRQEAAELAKTPDSDEAREWSYVEGKAALDLGDDVHALKIFQSLAKQTENPDKWAVQSQHLALDILNKQKRFQEIAQQAALWSGVTAYKSDVQEMQRVGREASFEYAASLGETPAALAEFNRFCQSGEFAEKSCPNARVLAIKLKDQATLVQVLERQNDQEALAVEYERMGRFADAAKILESRMANTNPEMDWIKISVLYQIAGDEASRARVLRKLAVRLRAQKKMSLELEGMVTAAFHRSEVSGSELLTLPWSMSKKLSLAAELESQGLGNAATKKMVLASKEDMGAVWAQSVFERMKAANQKQARVNFHGANSRANFQYRLKLLGQYARSVKDILPGASVPVRVILLNDLAQAYGTIDQAIMNTPLPAGLSEEQIAGAKAAMESLAAPLRAEGESYAKLSQDQQTEFAEMPQWQEALSQGAEAVVAQMRSMEGARKPAQVAGMDQSAREEVMSELARDPNSRSALEKLKNDFTTRGDDAAAAYFSGRLGALEQI